MKCTIAIPRFKEGLLRIYMQSKYTESLRRAGAKAVWITPDDLDKAIETMLHCDGLLLPGGEDMHPRYYGQEIDPKCGKIVESRDAAELKMMEAFFATGKPILGICRGAQVLNVYFGGTLHQDIAHLIECKHNDFPQRSRGTHWVTVKSGSKLAAVMEESTFLVNSMHHQAVDKPGNDLLVTAYSEDGIAEAFEHTQHPFCMGIQWHPEHMSAGTPLQRRIFDAFIRACTR